MKRAPWRYIDSLDRAHDRIRSLAAELSSTEQVAAGLQVDLAHHAARNIELQDEVCNLRRDVAELRGERRHMLLESASHRERAETLARMEEDSWLLAVARGHQLRQVGLIPAAVES